MKVTRARAAEHRLALLQQGGRMFRRHGIERVTIAEIARAAGLTHGAFYGHFPSKTELAAETVAASLAAGAAGWRRRAARARDQGADPLGAIIAGYLDPRHRDSPEDGCALAALGSEVSRAEPPLAAALHQGSAALAAALADEIAALYPTLDPAVRDRRALATLAAMTGGIVLARALAADPAASQAVLDAAAALARAAADA